MIPEAAVEAAVKAWDRLLQRPVQESEDGGGGAVRVVADTVLADREQDPGKC